MSIEDLEGDLERNLSDFTSTTWLTADDAKKYMADTLWPFLQNVVAEIRDQDNCIETLVNETDDILQADTAGIFAAVIVSAKMMMLELTKRLTKSPADVELLGKLKLIKPHLAKAEGTLEEITVFPEEDEGEEEVEEIEDGADGVEAGGEA